MFTRWNMSILSTAGGTHCVRASTARAYYCAIIYINTSSCGPNVFVRDAQYTPRHKRKNTPVRRRLRLPL